MAPGGRGEPADPTRSRPSHHHAAVAAIVALIGIPAAGGPPDVRCSLADERISESSGIAASSSTDEIVFTHNDSGDRARFFAVETGTCATRATYEVNGASNLDWEDMAAGLAADGAPVLWLADIGDNRARRASVVVYEVDEPAAGAPGGALRTRARRTLTYPDGPQDAETLIVDLIHHDRGPPGPVVADVGQPQHRRPVGGHAAGHVLPVEVAGPGHLIGGPGGAGGRVNGEEAGPVAAVVVGEDDVVCRGGGGDPARLADALVGQRAPDVGGTAGGRDPDEGDDRGDGGMVVRRL